MKSFRKRDANFYLMPWHACKQYIRVDKRQERYEMKTKISINKNIVFIGLPGCGKTAIGKEVSKRLSLPFCDIDTYIEKEEGKLIKEIFLQGEDYFRRLESQAIEEISKNYPSIISTGGGSIKIHSNMEALQKNAVIIFINRPVEHIIQDVDISARPLLAEGSAKLYELYIERYPLYKKYCDIEVFNDTDFNEVVDKVMQFIFARF